VETPFKPEETNRPLCLGRLDGVAAAVARTAIAKSHEADVLGRRGKAAAAHLVDRLVHAALDHRDTTIAEAMYGTLVTATGTAHYLRQADDNCHDVVHVRGRHKDRSKPAAIIASVS
jgi:hypothetical protein